MNRTHRVLGGLTALVLTITVLSGATLSTSAAPTLLLGDTNQSGTVNTTDARLVLQYAAEKTELDATALVLADVDGSGIVNTSDARQILQYAAEKISTFPAGVASAEDVRASVALVEEFMSIYVAAYTPESVAVLQEALDHATATADRADATDADRIDALLHIIIALNELRPIL